MSDPIDSITCQLNNLLERSGFARISDITGDRFGSYLALLLRWNSRINLTSIRDVDGILSRHFAESIACAQLLPSGIATLLDFGSGAGFPGIPIALCRAEIAVTLAESQQKKASFLRECTRVLGLATQVHLGRAESIAANFDCVTLRAVDRMSDAVRAACALVDVGGWLAIMTTSNELLTVGSLLGENFPCSDPVNLPGGGSRVLLLAQRIEVAK